MHSVSELLLFSAALAAAGAVSGFLAGLFGVGGGAILVPVFFQVFGLVGVSESVSMHVAVATSLAIIVPTSVRSFLGHKQRGAVDMAVLRSWVIAVPLGAVLAAFIAAQVSGVALRVAFTVFAALMALKMIFNRESWKIGDVVPMGPVNWLAGGAIGMASGLLGVGGGVLSNLWLSLFNTPVHRAVATSSGVGVLISIPGLAAYVLAGFGHPALPPFSTGFVNWIAVALVIPLSLVVAPLGVRLAHNLPRRRLEIVFGVFLAAVAIRFAISLL
jgi:uncharacterized membrane protein YfcA